MLSKTLLFLSLILATVNGAVQESTKKIKQGKYTYYHDDAASTKCGTIFLMAVGTAMSTTDYSEMAKEISKGQPIVTVITDHAPYFPVKFFPGQFSRLYNELTGSNLGKHIDVCEGKKPKILVGAHSASGMGSIKAMQKGKLNVAPDGYVGLDPYNINERKMKIDENLPVLAYGFEKTTCKVKINQSAKPTYNMASKDHRVFYRVHNTKQKIKHCAFTNNGCFGPICGSGSDADWVKGLVAKSVQAFVKAIRSGYFYKSQFTVSDPKFSYDLFVGPDEP